MARLLGPDMGSRYCYLASGAPAANLTAVVYSNSAGTILADIRAYDGSETYGATILGSSVTTDADGQLPLFWFPDGVDRLWVSVNGGTVSPVDADNNRRLDKLEIDRVFNVRAYGAVGDGLADDAAAIQSAIDAATLTGGAVYFPPGVYLCGSTITLPGGVHLRGAGVGGDIFSNVDAQLPFRGSVLKLKSGTNGDLIKTKNFDVLTGVSNPAAYDTPSRFGIHDLVLDGNKAGNASGWPLKIFGKTYLVSSVIIQNGASGGVYSEYGAGGYEMEARWSEFTITDCGGDGLEWRGPHDSLFVNGVVARNDGHRGVYVVPDAQVGGEMWTNVHVWGSHTYQWVIGGGDASYMNCIADGPGGVQLLGRGNTWVGGEILGTNVPGEVAITVGDDTPRAITGNRFITHLFNYAKGSAALRLRSAATSRNLWQLAARMSGNTRYVVGDGLSTLAAGVTLPVATLNLVDASAFPASGTVYLGDGTNVTTASYTGRTGNTLTGVTTGTGTFAAGSTVWSTAPSTASEWLEIHDTDSTVGGVFQNAQANATQFFLNSVEFNVGTTTVRPNTSATAVRWIRNETSRVDLAWDNTGSVGKITANAPWSIGGTGGNGYVQFDAKQSADPAAPAAGQARLFIRDSGGKTQMCVRFATGAVQVITTEP